MIWREHFVKIFNCHSNVKKDAVFQNIPHQLVEDILSKIWIKTLGQPSRCSYTKQLLSPPSWIDLKHGSRVINNWTSWNAFTKGASGVSWRYNGRNIEPTSASSKKPKSVALKPPSSKATFYGQTTCFEWVTANSQNNFCMANWKWEMNERRTEKAVQGWPEENTKELQH